MVRMIGIGLTLLLCVSLSNAAQAQWRGGLAGLHPLGRLVDGPGPVNCNNQRASLFQKRAPVCHNSRGGFPVRRSVVAAPARLVPEAVIVNRSVGTASVIAGPEVCAANPGLGMLSPSPSFRMERRQSVAAPIIHRQELVW